MARVRDLWHDKNRRKTARHPDNGGNKDAKRWLALWIGADGEEHGKVFAKQSDAQKYGTAMEADALRGHSLCGPQTRCYHRPGVRGRRVLAVDAAPAAQLG